MTPSASIVAHYLRELHQLQRWASSPGTRCPIPAEEFDAASVRAVANAAHDAVLIRTHNPLQASMVGARARAWVRE
jgi:hypothetical protein